MISAIVMLAALWIGGLCLAETITFPNAPFEMPAIAVPQFAAKDFSIADFGAKEGVKARD